MSKKMTQPSSGNASVPAAAAPDPTPSAVPSSAAPAAAQPLSIDVNIYRPSPKGPVLANASVTLNGCFAIRDITIRAGQKGPFVSMPSRKWGDTYRDICFPCTKEFRAQFDQQILDAYYQEMAQGMTQMADQETPGMTMSMN